RPTLWARLPPPRFLQRQGGRWLIFPRRCDGESLPHFLHGFARISMRMAVAAQRTRFCTPRRAPRSVSPPSRRIFGRAIFDSGNGITSFARFPPCVTRRHVVTSAAFWSVEGVRRCAISARAAKRRY